MIAEPLNDRECLEKLTQTAVAGVYRSDLRDLAARFATTQQLSEWIRTLPQRNDTGNDDEGPRVDCDVPQRARLVADDPNCVERSLLYLAAGELIDPAPARQLATIDTPYGRHTFPVEDGEAVVLDPKLSRNGLRAGLWMIRNGGATPTARAHVHPPELLGWLVELADDVAEGKDGSRGRERVDGGQRAFTLLLSRRPLTSRQRRDAVYTLRCAAEAAPLYGPTGDYGIRIARRAVAQLLADQLRQEARRRNVNWKKVGYWAGKAAATYFGVGGLYDVAYAVADEEVGKGAAAKPATHKTAAPRRRLPAASRKEMAEATRRKAVKPKPEMSPAKPVPIAGSLGALAT